MVEFRLVRKSLHHLLEDAAAARGLTIRLEHRPDMGGHNVYLIEGDPRDYTPGELADKLGVVWP